jgi:hypothetical protein
LILDLNHNPRPESDLSKILEIVFLEIVIEALVPLFRKGT